MADVLLALVRSFVSAVGNRRALALENVALRYQLMVLHRCPKRPQLTGADRAVWVILQRLWAGWRTGVLTVCRKNLNATAVRARKPL